MITATEESPASPTGPHPRHNPFRVHGRKHGHVKAARQAELEAIIQELDPATADSRAGWLALLGADPDQGRLILEIGFGSGIYLAGMAARYPRDRWIGVDLFLEGFASLIKQLTADGTTNIRVFRGSAQEFLTCRTPDAALDRVVIHFPDPWPKKRHHKRRLIQPEFLDLLAAKMRTGALLDLATDWPDYAEWMQDCLEGHSAFVNRMAAGGFALQPEEWIVTRFQQKGLDQGRPTWHLAYRKTG